MIYIPDNKAYEHGEIEKQIKAISPLIDKVVVVVDPVHLLYVIDAYLLKPYGVMLTVKSSAALPEDKVAHYLGPQIKDLISRTVLAHAESLAKKYPSGHTVGINPVPAYPPSTWGAFVAGTLGNTLATEVQKYKAPKDEYNKQILEMKMKLDSWLPSMSSLPSEEELFDKFLTKEEKKLYLTGEMTTVNSFDNTVVTPMSGSYSGLPQDGLLDVVPALRIPVKCPSCVSDNVDLWSTIQHLNDGHKWDIGDIANWLESLDVDISFKPKG